jgi:hypothetical protein
VQAVLAAIEASLLAQHLRASAWTYPLVSAAHILGIALLVGGIAPLDLRMAGLWRDLPIDRLASPLRAVAKAGAALAIATGLLLFSAGAGEYAPMPLFQVKLALIAAALCNAALHAGPLEGLAAWRLRAAGLLSLALWVAIVVCGRMLAYV